MLSTMSVIPGIPGIPDKLSVIILIVDSIDIYKYDII